MPAGAARRYVGSAWAGRTESGPLNAGSNRHSTSMIQAELQELDEIKGLVVKVAALEHGPTLNIQPPREYRVTASIILQADAYYLPFLL